jgi:hypothetical protein
LKVGFYLFAHGYVSFPVAFAFSHIQKVLFKKKVAQVKGGSFAGSKAATIEDIEHGGISLVVQVIFVFGCLVKGLYFCFA